MKTRILLADDHQIIREGLRSLIDHEPGMQVVAEARDGWEAVKKVRKTNPEVVIMDISMPGLNGIDAARMIKQEKPAVRIVALTVYTQRQFVIGAIEAGVSGFVLKECAFKELIRAIRAAEEGQVFLCPKITHNVVQDYLEKSANEAVTNGVAPALTLSERHVLQLIAEGHTTKSIASRLHISPKTVELRRRNIREKLNLQSTADLVKYALQQGLTSLSH